MLDGAGAGPSTVKTLEKVWSEMSRAEVRELKRMVNQHIRSGGAAGKLDAQRSSIALLLRSVRLGHKRLALRRLSAAIELGAEVPTECTQYCEVVVNEGAGPSLNMPSPKAKR